MEVTKKKSRKWTAASSVPVTEHKRFLFTCEQTLINMITVAASVNFRFIFVACDFKYKMAATLTWSNPNPSRHACQTCEMYFTYFIFRIIVFRFVDSSTAGNSPHGSVPGIAVLWYEWLFRVECRNFKYLLMNKVSGCLCNLYMKLLFYMKYSYCFPNNDFSLWIRAWRINKDYLLVTVDFLTQTNFWHNRWKPSVPVSVCA